MRLVKTGSRGHWFVKKRVFVKRGKRKQKREVKKERKEKQTE